METYILVIFCLLKLLFLKPFTPLHSLSGPIYSILEHFACCYKKKKKLNVSGLCSTIHNVDTVWQYQDNSACVYRHSCYPQGLSKGKETHGQAESPQHTTRCITNAAFHWGNAQVWQHEWGESNLLAWECLRDMEIVLHISVIVSFHYCCWDLQQFSHWEH